MGLKTDYLVIGSGIAGLSFALKAAESGKVLLITKSNEEESNTKYAQGGIAAVWHEGDSIAKHIADTLNAGAGLCDEAVVKMVVSEGRERVQELIALGTRFDRDQQGAYDLAREGGHSEHRILHHKDVTGLEIERALLQKVHQHPGITVFDHYYAIDLITQHHLGQMVKSSTPDITCYGAYVLNTRNGKVETILSRITLMATGGIGQVYGTTPNHGLATGDRLAMVYREKGK